MELLQQLSILIHVLIILISILVEIYRYKTQKRIFDILFLINALFGMYLGLIPILYQLVFPYFTISLYYLPTHIQITDFSKDGPFLTSLIILFSYISFLCFYFIFNKKHVKNISVEFNIDKQMKLLTWGIGTLSLVALFIYVNSFGGIVEAIVSANLIRRHDGATSSYTFLRYIYPLIQPAAILSWAIWFKFRRKFDFLVFIIFFAASVLFLLINAGRANIVVFFGVFFLTFLSIKNKFSVITLSPFILLGLALALFGNEIFTVLSGGEGSFTDSNSRIGLKLVMELSHIYVNLLKVNEFVFEGGRVYIFKDILISFVELLPGGIEKDIWNNSINTTKLHTAYFSPPAGTGIIVDIISYGYYQLGLPGSLFVSALFGVVCSKTDNFFRTRACIYYLCILTWTAFFYMGLLSSFELKSIILGRIAYWLPLLFIMYLSFKNYKGFSKNA